MKADRATRAAPGPAAAPAVADDVRLARLHLRVGLLSLALTELEDLERRALLSGAERALLAEARWRTGDTDGAADAARAHLDAGGAEPVALCIAAEAAAADGRPGEARSFMDRLGSPDAATLDALFAGMPRRAFWPSAPPEPTDEGTLSDGRSGFAPATGETRVRPPAARPSRSTTLGSAEAREMTSPGQWSDATNAAAEDTEDAAASAAANAEATATGFAGRPRHAAPSLEQDPVSELAVARKELSTHPDRGLLRLALVLRLDPTLAPAVLDAIVVRTEPAAAILRGDAQRLLGRHLEAEAAFASAADGLAADPASR